MFLGLEMIKMNYDATRRNRMGTMSRLGVNLILLEFFLLIIQFVIASQLPFAPFWYPIIPEPESVPDPIMLPCIGM